jgi:hypothetical protein
MNRGQNHGDSHLIGFLYDSVLGSFRKAIRLLSLANLDKTKQAVNLWSWLTH